MSGALATPFVGEIPSSNEPWQVPQLSMNNCVASAPAEELLVTDELLGCELSTAIELEDSIDAELITTGELLLDKELMTKTLLDEELTAAELSTRELELLLITELLLTIESDESAVSELLLSSPVPPHAAIPADTATKNV